MSLIETVFTLLLSIFVTKALSIEHYISISLIISLIIFLINIIDERRNRKEMEDIFYKAIEADKRNDSQLSNELETLKDLYNKY